ncbi:site-specific DNA-methyltransferase [Metapseudomonas otitidis]|uniref:site-specific DNA-methyltransferase n=1 Tax=Metapseudomonas otitidis TaxID=319939 RepID=UPI0013F6664B|nr:site-specific DNA-methyltransferase [Pseudomonas otitidis]
MTDKPKLELTWIGKDKRPRLEPRILLEDKHLSYRADSAAPSQGDLLAEAPTQFFHDNLLIQGDNLLALKALEAKYAGKVKCVFIDPPYNTGSAFTHYDDGVEHSLWLTLIRDRLEIIRNLLAEEGSLWITIDDNEAHYLKVLCDEIFGRRNFVANVVWQKAYTPNQTARHISNTHDHVLVYAKDTLKLELGKLGRTEDQIAKFSNHDNDPRGPWKAENLSAGKFYSAGQFEIIGPSGKSFLPPKGRYWRCNEAQFNAWLADKRITFGKGGDGRPMLKKFLAELKGGITPSTWWSHEEVGSNKEASLSLKQLFEEQEVFSTPKDGLK